MATSPFIIVAIDGGAASGKSSSSRTLSDRFDLLHVDTGSFYRALTAEMLRRGVRPDDLAALNPNPPDPNPLDDLLQGIPKELGDRVRRAIEGNLGGIDMDVQDGALEIAPNLQELKKRMEKAMKGMNGQLLVPGFVPKMDIQQGATFRMMDDQGSIELKSNDGSKEVTLRDKDNKIVWNGPWDTEQDKAAAPEDVRKRMDRLHLDTQFQGNSLRLHLGGPGPADDPP